MSDTPDIHFGSKTDPIIDNLPEYTRDPRNFMKIQRALLETLSCMKSHSEVLDIFKCKKCTENLMVRRQLMKKFGFATPAIYMHWRKNHENVKRLLEKDVYDKIIEGKS